MLPFSGRTLVARMSERRGRRGAPFCAVTPGLIPANRNIRSRSKAYFRAVAGWAARRRHRPDFGGRRQGFSWPVDAGTPGCRADPLRCGYAQEFAAARAGPRSADSVASRIPIPDDLGSLGASLGVSLGASLGVPQCEASDGRAGVRHSPVHRRRGARVELCVVLLVVFAAAEADRGQTLQQRNMPPLRVVLFGRRLAAAGANLVLRRHRQFVDPRHARAALRHPFRLWRDESPRFMRLRCGGRRLDEQGRLGRQRADSDL